MHLILVSFSLLTVCFVSGENRPEHQLNAPPQQGLNNQQYYGSQTLFRSAPTPVNESQDEDNNNQDHGTSDAVENAQFLNFIQQQGLLRRQNPSAYQIQQYPSVQPQQSPPQQLEQQRLGIPQNKQNLQQQQQIQAIQQQRLLQQQQALQQLIQQQQIQQQRFTPQLQQNQAPQQSQPPQQSQQIRHQSLLGVAYSPSNTVAKTRFVSNGISYSFR